MVGLGYILWAVATYFFARTAHLIMTNEEEVVRLQRTGLSFLFFTGMAIATGGLTFTPF